MNLLQFAKPQPKIEEYDQDLIKESPDRILFLIRLGHPTTKGEKYSRYDVIKEIERRGKPLLKALGWTTEDNSIYKNRYTGSERTLKELMSNEDGQRLRGESPNHQVFSIIEHWTPKHLWTDEDLFDEYKNKLSRWME